MKRHTKPISRFVIHNTETPEEPMDEAVERIRKIHVEKNGWEEIGYHYLVNPWTGEVRNTRPVKYQGAHCKGFNDGSIGIGILGDWREGECCWHNDGGSHAQCPLKAAVPPAGVFAVYKLLLTSKNYPMFLVRGFEVNTHAGLLGLDHTDCGTGGIKELVLALRKEFGCDD